MKPVVIWSRNDLSDMRCVDIRQDGAGFSWVECRRDVEDTHGWRIVSGPFTGFDSADAALTSAKATTPWMARAGFADATLDGSR